MEKKTVNPWKWQENRSYQQAVEVSGAQGILYVSGQAAIDHQGISSSASMDEQLELAIKNLETVVSTAGYDCKHIVRLTVYTTSTDALWPHFNILQDWIAKHQIKQALTMVEVSRLFETLSVELEATVVR